jgi:hypothetical protein
LLSGAERVAIAVLTNYEESRARGHPRNRKSSDRVAGRRFTALGHWGRNPAKVMGGHFNVLG